MEGMQKKAPFFKGASSTFNKREDAYMRGEKLYFIL